jgi:ADP-ribose pyrophosphatase YjhB (NUDIX family)
MEVRALLRLAKTHYLLIRANDDPRTPWSLPGGPVPPQSSPVATAGRLFAAQVGTHIDLLIPQGAVSYLAGGQRIMYHYFACAVAHDEALPLGCDALCWATAEEMAALPLEPGTRLIAERLADQSS